MSSRSLFMTILLATLLAAPWALAGEIHQAAADGDTERVAALIDADPELIVSQAENPTLDLPLHTAAAAGHTDVVRLLLDAGAEVDAGDRDLSTPLHVAALRGHLEAVNLLIDRGASLAFQDNNGAWSMSFALSGNDDGVIARLIEAGAPLDLVNSNGSTLAHFAAMRGRVDLLDRLIAAGADVNSTDNWERSPLWFAASSGSLPLTTALIAAGADVNKANVIGRSGLIGAAASGHTDVVRALLDAGAHLDLREARCGQTALHLAAGAGYDDIVGILAGAGASLMAQDRHNHTPLDLATIYAHKACAATLLARGAVANDDASPCPSETGCLIACPDDVDSPDEAVAAGDARIWYLGHAGYAVQTRNNLLIFDYWNRGRSADEPALANGYIDPAEIAGMKVTVFVSHEHGDHFDPTVFEWADKVASIRYVMGCPAETTVAYDLLEPRTLQSFDGVTVRTIDSNDSGLGYLVDCDGVTIYHAGDHANRLRDFSGPYCAEIDWLATAGARPDIAFMPVTGCNFGDQVAVKMGVEYALEKLQPKIFVPLHAGGNEWRYDDFIDGCRNDHPAVKMIAPRHRGDHHDYRGGKIS